MGQGTLLPIVTATLGLVSAGLVAAIYQILRQQGRMLMRLDQIEEHLSLGADEAVARGSVALQAHEPAGLAVGTSFSPFELPDLDDRIVALESFRGRRVVLVNWNAHCGFCDLIAADLARLKVDLERAGIQLLLLSQGTAAAERECAEEHGLAMPILLQGRTPLAAFARLGTPAAYLLDEEGRVARPLALGATQVPALIGDLAPVKRERKWRLPGERPLSESRIERNGLKAGTPAPAFTLPEVRGGEVSLDRYRGRKVLMVFSDPHCGPCDGLAPDLVRLHQAHRNNGLDLLLISRGDPEENRVKAERYGFEFPMLLQKKWEISKQYGIFATPVGFLIDEEGVIARDVARGADEILALVSSPVEEEGSRS